MSIISRAIREGGVNSKPDFHAEEERYLNIGRREEKLENGCAKYDNDDNIN